MLYYGRMTEATLQEAETFLINADPKLGVLIQRQSLSPLEQRGDDYFSALVRSIIGQQVSVAAARAIAQRFTDKTNLQPEKTLLLSEEDIKAIGLSRQKASYIRDLAQHFADNPNVYNHLDALSDDAVIADLIAVKGIGVWTAQMFLLFTLQRPDVFAPDDGGLQRAMMKVYSWDTLPPKKELVRVAERWQPYRTVASLHLWRSLDNTPT